MFPQGIPLEFKNETTYEFNDISTEKWRKYKFIDGSVVKIKNPLKLHVSENGHRVFDVSGISHYVPLGWIHLSWKTKEGQAHFVQ